MLRTQQERGTYLFELMVLGSEVSWLCLYGPVMRQNWMQREQRRATPPNRRQEEEERNSRKCPRPRLTLQRHTPQLICVPSSTFYHSSVIY